MFIVSLCLRVYFGMRVQDLNIKSVSVRVYYCISSARGLSLRDVREGYCFVHHSKHRMYMSTFMKPC
jgi:hypothetical protein